MDRETYLTFDQAWEAAKELTGGRVQDKEELQQTVEYIGKHGSVLEIGSAEGFSAVIWGHTVLEPGGKLVMVDYGEKHTEKGRKRAMESLSLSGRSVSLIRGNSHAPSVIADVQAHGQFDVVYIDAGHTYEDVVQDYYNYGVLAKKFVVFHDIKLPEVGIFWSGLKGKKVEFVTAGSKYGIGVLHVFA